MRSARIPVVMIAALAGVPGSRGLAAQRWNDSVARALVERAIARRAAELADSGLRDYHARAHGFVFFLGQLGEGFNDPPTLIKTDQLESEVYWRAPGASKQRIIGWRDRTDLPTDIRYHRDHLGIVQNGFADRIRIGEGDEVRDVPHPLSPSGAELYDFAVTDSLTLELPQRTIEVYELLVRPRDFTQPRVVGAVYLDVGTAELVRFRFDFTPPSYLDRSLEDITVVLENAIWGGRFWLPRRQEIEIRRRTEWLDLPARGIIRGRWEIDGYDINVGLADSLFRGPEIVAAPPAARDSFPWRESLRGAMAEVSRAPANDVEAVRAQMVDVATGHALHHLAEARPAVGSLSDIAHFNRVEGLALGAGYRVRISDQLGLSGWASYGTSAQRVMWRLGADWTHGRWTLAASARKEARDVADEPVVSTFVNSLSSQEAGRDLGDYVQLERLTLSLTRRESAGHVALTLSGEDARPLGVVASPAWGTFRPNPALGPLSVFWGAALDAEAHGGAVTSQGAWSIKLRATAATRIDAPATERYARAWMTGHWDIAAGATTVRLSGSAGMARGDVPGYRAFVLGGWGTLPGEPFRAYGGRTMALGRVEWALPVPFPPLPLGSLGTTGSDAVFAPFLAVGWAGDPIAGTPWAAADGPRPVAGAAVEIFHRLIRAELGVGLRDGGVGFSIDVLRDLWPIL